VERFRRAQLRHDRSVELDNPLGTPTGQSALVELKRLDTIVTTSLVVNF